MIDLNLIKEYKIELENTLIINNVICGGFLFDSEYSSQLQILIEPKDKIDYIRGKTYKKIKFILKDGSIKTMNIFTLNAVDETYLIDNVNNIFSKEHEPINKVKGMMCKCYLLTFDKKDFYEGERYEWIL